MKPALAVLLALSLTSLAACGGGGDGGGDPIAPAPTEPVPSGEVPETLLEGVWESPCSAAASPASARRFVVQVTDSVFSFADITYGDAACTEESALSEIDTRGTFVEPVPEDGRFIEDGRPIDLSVEEVILIPRQRIATNLYNELMLCGTDGWATNVSRSIDGCADETGTVEANTDVPRTDYNLFLVEDAGTPDARADDRLLLGTVQSVTDPAQRPGGVDANLPFTRRAGSLARPL